MSSPWLGLAHALVRVSLESGETKRVMDELEIVQPLLLEHKRYFNNPLVKPAEASKMLRGVLTEAGCSRLTIEFLCLLIEKRRIKLLPFVMKHYIHLAHKELGDAEVLLRAPYKFNPEMLDKLRDFFVLRGLITKEQRQSARITMVVDEGLLGGFQAECGGFVLDKSVKTQINRLSATGG